MQCAWVKRLFGDDFHDWKIMPLFLIRKYLGKNFKFHNNNNNNNSNNNSNNSIDISNDILSKFTSFYQNIFIK